MSHLCSFIQLIERYCNEDSRIDSLVKKIDLLEKENTLLTTQNKDHEHENMRLQMELYNVETLGSTLKPLPGEESVETISGQLMETCTNIRYSISQIDFAKIVQCNHTQMEQNYRKEWQQLQEYTVSMLKWHEKMEQRDVVQRYRKVGKSLKEMEQNCQKIKSDNEKSIKQNIKRLKEAKQHLNTMILRLIESVDNFNKLQETTKYANILIDLEREKTEIQEKLASEQTKTFSSMMPYKNEFYSNKTASSNYGGLSAFHYDMPKFPTFTDILKTFNQDLNQNDLIPQITMVENTTNIMVKSVLRNSSQDNSMEINQSITTKRTKELHFTMKQFNETTGGTIISDNSSDYSSGTKNENSQLSLAAVTREPKMETDTKIKKNVSINEKTTTNQIDKPKVDILECIIIKPSDIKERNDYATHNKENLPPNSVNFNLLQENDLSLDKSNNEIMAPPPKPVSTEKKHKNLKKSLYDEFLKEPSSLESCSEDLSESDAKSTDILKDFDFYFNENSKIPDITESKKNDQSHSLLEVKNNNDTTGNEKDCGNVLDFGGQELTFDSNDASDNDLFSRGNIVDFFS